MSVRRLVACIAALVFCSLTSCEPRTPDEAASVAEATAAATVSGPTMIDPRAWGAGVLLADGRVLVTGGDLASNRAEILDPATSTWTATPPLTGLWAWHIALRLVDGRALLACAQQPADWAANTNFVEVYDPTSDSWAHYGSYANRLYCTAARLSDGRVLITGGYDSKAGAFPAPSLIFDPATNTLSAGAPLATPRFSHAMVALADGRILVIGGRPTTSSSGSASVEIYDPATGAFVPGPSMNAPRTDATATLLADGRVLVAGGNLVAGTPDAEVFDPAAGTWAPVGTMGTPRSWHSAVRLADGRVILVGGFPRTGGSPTAKVDVFDPVIGTFSPGMALPAGGRRSEISLLLPDGRVLVAGGILPGMTSGTSSTLYYDPACSPTTCAAVGAQCGSISDGCGSSVSCGTCPDHGTCDPQQQTCQPCQPATCATLGATCGWIGDGCGNTLACGTCPSGQVCGAGLTCTCQPATCAAQGSSCGPTPDGCGGVLDCGACGEGDACQNNQCVCAPDTCPAGFCGFMPDGCGFTLYCDPCASGESCVAGACATPPANATYDAVRGAPVCNDLGPACSSGALLVGRGPLGPEPGAPNTIDACEDGAAGTFHADRSIDAIRVAAMEGGPLTQGAMIQIDIDLWFTGPPEDIDIYLAADADAPRWTYRGGWHTWSKGPQTLSFPVDLPLGKPLQAVRVVMRAPGTPSACPGGAYDDVDDLVFRVAPPPTPPDVIPPQVALVTPTSGAILGATIPVQVDATDDVGVVSVDLYVDDISVKTLTDPPYAAELDASWLPDGWHDVRAVAADAAGNTSVFDAAVVIDNTPPTVTLTSPSAGAVGAGTVALKAATADANGVVRVDFFDGASLVGTAWSSPWSVSWAAGAGTHTLMARATDAAGNVGRSPEVKVVVTAPPAPPGNAVYSPARRAPACLSPVAACDSGTLLNGRSTRLGPEPNASNAINGSCSDGTGGIYHSDESVDRLRVSTLDGGPFAPGKAVKVEATVWAFSATGDKLDLWYAANAAAPQWVLAGTVTSAANGLQTLSRTFTLPSGPLQAVRAMYRYGGSASSPCVSGTYNDVDDLVFAVQ